MVIYSNIYSNTRDEIARLRGMLRGVCLRLVLPLYPPPNKGESFISSLIIICEVIIQNSTSKSFPRQIQHALHRFKFDEFDFKVVEVAVDF